MKNKQFTKKSKYSLMLVFALMLFSVSIYSQISVNIDSFTYANSGQPTKAITNCNGIDFGSSTSSNLNVAITIKKPFNQVLGNNLEVIAYTLKTGSSQPVKEISVTAQDSFFTQPSSGLSTYSTTLNFTLQKQNFNTSGGVVYFAFKVGTTEYTSDCKYPITKPLEPTFTLSPKDLYIPCGSLSPVTLSVSEANIPSGQTATYFWNTQNWSGTSNGKTITLTPVYPYSLPSNVTVTPTLNGKTYPTLTCQVSRDSFYSGATITGTQNICQGSANYSISNIDPSYVVTWSLSNNTTATLSNATNTSVKVNFNGTGQQILKASIKNSCDQVIEKTFVINDGSPTYNSLASISGNTSGFCSGNRNFNLVNLSAGESVVWSIVGYNIANLNVISNSSATISAYGNGLLKLIATITNSCGKKSIKQVEMYIGSSVLRDTATNFTFCQGGYQRVENKITLASDDPTISEYQWFLGDDPYAFLSPVSDITIIGNQNSNSVFFNVPLFATYAPIFVRAKNNCGWSDWLDVSRSVMNCNVSGGSTKPDRSIRFLYRSANRGIDKSNSFSISPNPSNGNFTIKLPNETSGNYHIYNLNGSEISTAIFDKTSELNLDLTNEIQSGVYFIRIETETEIFTEKIVKQ